MIADYNYIFTFGKYKGSKLQDIVIDDPGYVLWVDENVNTLQISRDIIEEAYENKSDLDSMNDPYWDHDFNDHYDND